MTTPAHSNNSFYEGLNTRSLLYADDFVVTSEALRTANDQAVLMQAPRLSNGTTATLTMLAKAVNAQAIVEIGTGTGASGLAFFQGMEPHGILTSIDSQAQWQLEARKIFLAENIPTRRFRLIPGQPLDVLNNLRDGAYDIVFINANKLEYVEYLAQALRLLRSGGMVIMNDVLWQDKVADPDNEDDEALIIREALSAALESEELTNSVLPVGDGLLVGVRD